MIWLASSYRLFLFCVLPPCYYAPFIVQSKALPISLMHLQLHRSELLLSIFWDVDVLVFLQSSGLIRSICKTRMIYLKIHWDFHPVIADMLTKPVILRYFVSWGEILAMSSDALSVWNLQNQTLDHEYIKCFHLQRLIHDFSAVIVSVWSIMF